MDLRGGTPANISARLICSVDRTFDADNLGDRALRTPKYTTFLAYFHTDLQNGAGTIIDHCVELDDASLTGQWYEQQCDIDSRKARRKWQCE